MIDVENFDELTLYLRATQRIDRTETPACRILSGGVSNKTILVARRNGEKWVIKQALPKLRVGSDWFSDPARILVEANGLRYLPHLTPPGSITPFVFEDRSQHLLAMAAVPEPHEIWKRRLLAGNIDKQYFQQFAQIIGSIHSESTKSWRQLNPVFSNKQHFHTLRLEAYYEYTATVVPRAATFLRDLARSTLSRADALVHGDASPKNVLVFHDHLILLDHEVLHIGDPGFDVGFSMTHFLSKALHLPKHRDQLLEAALYYWSVYLAKVSAMPWAADLSARAARHTLGSLLARVSGRSPLEYLAPEERLVQRDIAIEMMNEEPATLEDVLTGFKQRILAQQTPSLHRSSAAADERCRL
ncbi:MAG TPA: phosphotransferase [Chthoniobacterales bacterium]|nr:phosphotransferase [Chthoniobacterales bacterium]